MTEISAPISIRQILIQTIPTFSSGKVTVLLQKLTMSVRAGAKVNR